MQDAYSLRCMPQVHGAVRGALSHCEDVLRLNLRRRLIIRWYSPDTGDVISGGNFHGAPLALRSIMRRSR